MDAILEAYSEEFPKKLKFERKRDKRGRETVEAISTQWANRLIGKARDEARKKFSFDIPERFHRARPATKQAPSTNQAKPVVKMPHRPVGDKRR